ncbi:MAG TPA: amino acid permease, partial [Rhodothermales bacterium]|nr:amino acid permease [Rhodothermales bacterium]
WGYDGWNNLALVAGEVKDPKRNIPRAFLIGTGLIIILYVFVNAAYYFVMAPEAIASVAQDGGVVAIEVLRRVLGPVGVTIMAVGLMLSSFGTLHSSVLSGARVPYAMSRDGLLPKKLSEVNPRTRIPVTSVLVQGVWASVLALSGSFDTLTDYVIFGSWIFYGLTTSSVFVLRRKYPNVERPYKTWGYPVVPALFLLVTAFLLSNTLYGAFVQAWGGVQAIAGGDVGDGLYTVFSASPIASLILIGAGLPIYAYYARRGGTPHDPFADESLPESALEGSSSETSSGTASK